MQYLSKLGGKGHLSYKDGENNIQIHKSYNRRNVVTIIALKASGRDCTNNNELLHKIGVLQRYVMQLFLFTRELLQAIRWRSKYNCCTQRI